MTRSNFHSCGSRGRKERSRLLSPSPLRPTTPRKPWSLPEGSQVRILTVNLYLNPGSDLLPFSDLSTTTTVVWGVFGG